MVLGGKYVAVLVRVAVYMITLHSDSAEGASHDILARISLILIIIASVNELKPLFLKYVRYLFYKIHKIRVFLKIKYGIIRYNTYNTSYCTAAINRHSYVISVISNGRLAIRPPRFSQRDPPAPHR